ncbi:MAG: amino acid transporter [Stappia sp.]|uniref:LysE family translocator n=1 Tax=Stappia sp. TaxID=1870903 RepID=UPI000C62F224|nr:LysE family translocator [Stappia sp.]MAB00385.1 amino acid transporter [Stappia sp.]MBM19800.1 amino acid transporter [Stappia sp.]
MLAHQVAVLAGLTALIMISPGPDMIIVLRNTLLHGRGAGLLTSLGVLAGNLVHIGYCAVGVGFLISQSILAFSILKYLAAAYLLYLGVMSIRNAGGRFSLDIAAKTRTSRRSAWTQGFLNNILNPKGTLFYLGVFTMIVTPQTSAAGVAVLVATTISVSAAFWVVFVMTLDAAPVRRVLEGAQAMVSRVLGGVLILLGLRIAVADR